MRLFGLKPLILIFVVILEASNNPNTKMANVLATLVKTFISRHCGGIVSDKSKKKTNCFKKSQIKKITMLVILKSGRWRTFQSQNKI